MAGGGVGQVGTGIDRGVDAVEPAAGTGAQRELRRVGRAIGGANFADGSPFGIEAELTCLRVAGRRDREVLYRAAMTAKRNPGKSGPKLLVAMTGKASPAKAAEGDGPVFAYIASLPTPQRKLAERVDALAAKTLPNLQRAVKWGMAYYGVDGGWCFSCGAFVGHVKLMFIRGTELEPEPPVTPIGMGKATRGVELRSTSDLRERQVAAWMEQAAAIPFFGNSSKKKAPKAVSKKARATKATKLPRAPLRKRGSS